MSNKAKVISLIVCISILLLSVYTTAFAQTVNVYANGLLGDYSGNSRVNSEDLSLFVHYLLNKQTDGYNTDYDFNSDNADNILDLVLLKNLIGYGYSGNCTINECKHTVLKVTGNMICCLDCGMCGRDFRTKYDIMPSVQNEGKLSYNFEYKGESRSFSKVLPKTVHANWVGAFYNDFDCDGLPELKPTTYTGTTRYSYLYAIKESDYEGYPNVDDYDFLTDEEWEDYDRIYFEIEEETQEILEKYGADSEEYREFSAGLETDSRMIALLQYEEKDAKAYELYDKDVAVFRATHDLSKVGYIEKEHALTLDETNTLCYWLHIPYDYDPNKSYPIILFCPGEGGKFSDYVDANGNVKGENVVPYSGDWCSSFFINWYNQVKDPGAGREKYDCFILNIYGTNGFFRGERPEGYPTAKGIVNMYTAPNIPDAHKYTAEEMGGNYKYSYMSCYDSSYLEPAKDAQLAVQLIDKMMAEYNIDANRQYILGASLGGIFTMDTISHYPDRFAAAVPVVSASADISEKNCKNLTNMNIWAISGSGDSNCSKYHSKLFVNSINACKEKYDINNDCVAQYSFFPGGHSCGYIGSTLRKADEGVSITYSTQVLDFMFDSVRQSTP